MKHELTLWYSVQNGGDGSAYPQFMESEELAEFDQDNMDTGWGESCTGSIELESDSPITVKDKVTTKESYLIGLLEYCSRKSKLKSFVKEFFPDGFPKFEVTTSYTGNDAYLYNHVLVDGVEVAKSFKTVATSGDVFANELNNINIDSSTDEEEEEDEDW